MIVRLFGQKIFAHDDDCDARSSSCLRAVNYTHDEPYEEYDYLIIHHTRTIKNE